jgi:hypothetical protein
MQGRLGLVATGGLDGEQRRHVDDSAGHRAQNRAAPHGAVGSSHVAAESHAGLVRADDEFRVLPDPRAENEHDVRDGLLLPVAAPRHAERSPS